MITLPASDDEKLRQVQKLEAGQFSEEELEIALIVVPDLFDPAPFFCGRQLQVESGALDLFGLVGRRPSKDGFKVEPEVVWGNSFPTVYELKARKLRREHVCQALDYALAIREMNAEDLAWHLVRNSKDDTGIPRMNPKDLQGMLESHMGPPRWVFPVLVGTDYDANVARLAKHTEVELYTVSELCQGYRARQSTVHGNRQ